MPVYCFHYSAREKCEPSKRKFGGAFVNVLISYEDAYYGERIARMLIRDAGWIPSKLKEYWIWTRGVVRKKAKREKQYYEEAVKQGYCVVFHTYPRRDGRSGNSAKRRK